MTRRHQDVRLTSGETRYLDYTVDGDSVDLNAAQSISWEADTDALVKTVANGGITVTDTTACQVELTATDTIAQSGQVLGYELWVTDSGGDVSLVATGEVTIIS